jgi:hypothetical protein
VVAEKKKLMCIIGGSAGHGKDTFGEMVHEIFDSWASARLDSYAYTLKEIAHISLGIPWETLTANKDVKESTYVHIAGEKTEITVRQALQKIGQWNRNTFGYLIWADSVRRRSQFASERVTIVTDARHPEEEIHWMRKACGEFAHVFVVRVRNSRIPVTRGHPSEDLIADEPDKSFDFLVENEGTLDDLRVQAQQLACALVVMSKKGKKKVAVEGDGWFVVCPDGAVPYEPLLTPRDAAVLANGATKACCDSDEPHRVIQSTYRQLAGGACGD